MKVFWGEAESGTLHVYALDGEGLAAVCGARSPLALVIQGNLPRDSFHTCGKCGARRDGATYVAAAVIKFGPARRPTLRERTRARFMGERR